MILSKVTPRNIKFLDVIMENYLFESQFTDLSPHQSSSRQQRQQNKSYVNALYH